MKYYSFDFGASTVDMVVWKNSLINEIKSFEALQFKSVNSVRDFFTKSKISLKNIDKIFITGGKTQFFENSISNIDITKIPEIDAIGRGAYYLAKNDLREDKFLTVSMGTGTCMVLVRTESRPARHHSGGELRAEVEVNTPRTQFSVLSSQFSALSSQLSVQHIGGTGIGGGTFLGLCKEILGETDILKLKEMFKKGDIKKVDLSVGEIVGSSIGIVSQDNTASNLGKLVRNIDFSKADLAVGIVNLVAQAIATNIIFATKAYMVKEVILVGKLILMEEILDAIRKLLKEHEIEVYVPKNASHAIAIGGGSVINRF